MVEADDLSLILRTQLTKRVTHLDYHYPLVFLRNLNNANGQSFFVSLIRPATSSANDTVFNIANLSINQTRGWPL